MSVRFFTPITAVCAVVISTFIIPQQGHALDLKGRTVEMIITSSAGGGSNHMGRLVGKYLSRYLPGKPDMLYRNMPGAAGAIGLNHFYANARTDGTDIVASDISVTPDILRRPMVRYDPNRLVFIGGLPAPGGVMIVTKSEAHRLKDTSTKPLIMGGVTGTRTSNQLAVWAPNYLGWNIRWVVGYKGSGAMNLALERNETQVTVTYNSSVLYPLRDAGTHIFPLQVGIWQKGKLVPRPDFPDAPVLADLIRPKLSGIGLEAFEAWQVMAQIGKWYALPPGTPEDIAASYRAAWDLTAVDKEFDAEVKKFYSDIYTVADAAEMADTVRKLSEVKDGALNHILQLRRKVGIPEATKKK